MMFHNTEKTETCHGNVKPQWQSSCQKLALIFSFTNLC